MKMKKLTSSLSTFCCCLISFVLLMLLPSSSLINAAVVCPPSAATSPCGCREYQLKLGTIYIDCYAQKLNDSQVSDILDIFLASPSVSPFSVLDLRFNQLTRIPTQTKSFKQLLLVLLNENSITSIESGAFNSPDVDYPIHSLNLQYNQLTTIAPGSFKGDLLDGAEILLYDNNLTRFESTVFQSVLEKKAEVNVDYSNPIDCSDCHLAWLIRDNRDLLPAVYGGKCSNGTSFEQLNPNGFADCPSFVCPLGYDGYYTDPSNCSSFYICRDNVAYPYDCPADLVFNPETNQCDLVSNVVGSCGPPTNGPFVCPNSDGYFVDPLSCSNYYLCIDSQPILVNCPPGFVFNPDKNQCDKPENVPSCSN